MYHFVSFKTFCQCNFLLPSKGYLKTGPLLTSQMELAVTIKPQLFIILRNTDKDCILMHNFYISLNFVWVFKGCSDKNDWNFDDVSKIGYSRPS